MQRWIDFMGVEGFTLPDDNAVTNPALLIALAGKRCYRSFTVDEKQNSNITKIRTDYAEYIDNVMKSGHGSVLEHSVFNFAIENASRVFTAEMNRHRAGWAISEGSLRFIRFGENIPYWVPDSIKGDDTMGDERVFKTVIKLERGKPEEVARVMAELTLEERKQISRYAFRDAFTHQERNYRLLEKVWGMDEGHKDFAYKKVVTSMMRRIVGLGVATGGVWSGNIRALRHVMTMRCEPSAEEEILHVFSRVVMMMKEREPLLFGDFVKDDAGFWRPKYRKI